ncbi:hypothetical protein D9758_013749 [Tetrapyrgos nigripes]|uniref:Uncharacterized protein n=1 Tax=Tetrapyrgos nigripes TaxID=182062 RepID=A0A8H5G1R5_9AGAR|nr:hypothetical protein D9758_013749 [Tetrapyrgos nigripes]
MPPLRCFPLLFCNNQIDANANVPLLSNPHAATLGAVHNTNVDCPGSTSASTSTSLPDSDSDSDSLTHTLPNPTTTATHPTSNTNDANVDTCSGFLTHANAISNTTISPYYPYRLQA